MNYNHKVTETETVIVIFPPYFVVNKFVMY